MIYSYIKYLLPGLVHILVYNDSHLSLNHQYTSIINHACMTPQFIAIKRDMNKCLITRICVNGKLVNVRL